MNKKERQEKLRKRQQENIKNKDVGGLRKRALNLPQGTEIFKPEIDKKYVIDIIPYYISTKNHPSVVTKPKEWEIGDIDYVLEFYVHRGIGVNSDDFLCLTKTYGKPCPICEEQKILRDAEADQKDISALNAQRKVAYNICDANNDNKGIQIFIVSHYLFERVMLEEIELAADDGERILIGDIDDGKSISFNTVKGSFGGRSYPEFRRFRFKNRDPYEEDVIKEALPLDKFLVIPTYDEIKNAFYGQSSEEDEREVADEAPKQERKRKSLRRKENTEEKKNSSKCPNNHEFGKDIDNYDECNKCEIWEECADENEK